MFLFVYLALLIRLIMPTVYQTVRVSILGNLPDTSQINIASQMAWVNVVIEIIDESLIVPLYFCLGDSINDARITKNKIKTGLITSGFVYCVFSILISSLAWPLIRLMGQNIELQEDTVSYIRIEVFGIIAGSLVKFLMLVFIMRQWNSMLYLTLFVQMLFSSMLDYGFASTSGLNLGANGIAYSAVCTNIILLIICLLITWIKLDFQVMDLMSDYNFYWLKNWSRVGLFSGFDSFIRNAVYLIVVLRAINLLNEQGDYKNYYTVDP